MALALDGVALDDPAGRWALNADSRVRQPPPAIINDVAVPGLHGTIPALSSTYGPASSVLAFDIETADYAGVLANLAALTAAVGSRAKLRTLTDESYRALVQFVSSSELEIVAGDSFARVAFTFSIPSGFWQDASSTTVALSSGANAPAELQGGSAPIVDALFIVDAGVTVTDDATETWFRWDGPGSARVNPLRGTAYSGTEWTGGSNVSGGLTLGPGQFQLTPEVALTLAGGAGQVRARRAYL